MFYYQFGQANPPPRPYTSTLPSKQSNSDQLSCMSVNDVLRFSLRLKLTLFREEHAVVDGMHHSQDSANPCNMAVKHSE